MKKVLITFGGAAYDKTIAQTIRNAHGVDEVRVYDDRWLMTTDFYRINKWVFEAESNVGHRIGFGWCCWKPFIILEEFKRLNTGDVVLYVDADTYPIADLTPLFDIAQRERLVLFCELVDNKRFTKRDCFIAMGEDTEEAYSAPHSCGRFQLFQKGSWIVQQVLYEWLTYSLNPLCQVSDFRTEDGAVPSEYGEELPEFHRHSAEQSVLTLLAHKYGIKLHRVPCQYGWPAPPGFEADTYPQLFHQEYCMGDRADLSGSRFRNV